ncbi:MAG TPA: hypothetical protein VGY56_20635 [Verrucomicrobiae bacterium]|nr:hypothetical protein [Verrucomicrobiae bacterium]
MTTVSLNGAEIKAVNKSQPTVAAQIGDDLAAIGQIVVQIIGDLAATAKIAADLAIRLDDICPRPDPFIIRAAKAKAALTLNSQQKS